MFKQSDAYLILIVLTAVVGVFVLSSETASLVVVAALAAVSGGLVGVRIRWARHAAEPGEPASDDRQVAAATDASHGEAPAGPQPDAPGAADETQAAVVAEGSPVAPDNGAAASAEVIEAAMLAGVLVDTVCEGITFKDTEGSYRYANAVFAHMFGLQPSEIIGKGDGDIFGYLTATSLIESDERVSAAGRIATMVEIPVEVGSRFYEITKALVGDGDGGDGGLEGIIAVWRDVTDATLERRRREKAMGETIAAFTKSIQFNDPYLAGHAQRLARLATAVADTLGLDDSVRTTVELAAYLSQLGKLGIDPKLLTMQRRLTDDEIREVQKHVHHTARLLRDLDFGLPVAATLFQMHERLDGEGYPKGVRGGDIALPARILGVCDVFCARTAPRSYRVAIPSETAIGILRQNVHRYDEAVIEALSQVVTSPHGEQLLA